MPCSVASEAVDLFLELAALSTPPGRERPAADRCLEYLRGLGLDPREDDAAARIGGDTGNIHVRIEPTGPGTPLFLCAHLDTVPLEAPVEPILVNGVITNRHDAILGADNKATVAGMLDGLRRLLAEDLPHAGVELVLTPQEEVGLVGAKAFDRYGQYGSVRSKTMTVNRRRPFAPQGLRAGRNGAVVDVEWAANPEGDLRGYRVYRLAADGSATQVCALTVMLACQDTAPPADGDLRYVAVAVDFDTAGALREGDQSAIAVAPHVNAPPAAPVAPTITTTDGVVKLTWGRPDPEDPNNEPCGNTTYRICYFNIYRDGQLFANRYDRTATGAQLEWTDSQRDGVAHTYYVASVDARLAESAKVLAVAP